MREKSPPCRFLTTGQLGTQTEKETVPKAGMKSHESRVDSVKSMSFDYSLDFANIDFRRHPELYRIGKGEQGVLLVEPYKSEILPHWKFKTPQMARRSANWIYKLFLAYKAKGDFVGMDMARILADGVYEVEKICQPQIRP